MAEFNYWDINIKCERPGAVLQTCDHPMEERINRWALPHGEYEVVSGIDGSLSEEEAVQRAFQILANEFLDEFVFDNKKEE